MDRRDRARWWTHVPTWALLCGTVGALVGAVLVAVWLASEPVPAIVQRAADAEGRCAVTWADPWDGAARSGGITCRGEQPGAVVPGLALAAPARGTVLDTGTFPTLSAVLVAPLLAAAGVGAGLGGRSRRPVAGRTAHTPRVPQQRAAPDGDGGPVASGHPTTSRRSTA